MNAVDTNILLRYIVNDDAEQYAKAEAFLKARTADDPAFVTLVVLVELIWVLRRLYRFPPTQIHSALTVLLETAELAFEEEQFVATLVVSGTVMTDELADHIIAYSASKAGCTRTVTFDTRAASRAPGMELLS